MNRPLAQTRLSQPGRLIRLTLLVSLILLLATIVLVTANQFINIPDNQAAVEAAIEDRYGIHVTMVAVTAGGGVVDFRFQVVDPEKANIYMHGPTSELPILIVGKSGTRIDPRPHTHHVNYEFGRTYYTIYRNPRGVVEPGSQISVQIGDLLLRNIEVR